MKKANQLDIGCMTHTSAEQFNWCAISHLTILKHRIDHTEGYVETATKPAEGAKLFAVGAPEMEITVETLSKVGKHFFENSPDIKAYEVGVHKHCLRHNDPQLFARDLDGTEHTAVQARYTYDFEVTDTVSGQISDLSRPCDRRDFCADR